MSKAILNSERIVEKAGCLRNQVLVGLDEGKVEQARCLRSQAGMA